MARYKTRSVEIDATQFFPPTDSVVAAIKYARDLGVVPILTDDDTEQAHLMGFRVCTHQGMTKVNRGDWIITSFDGEKYPCNDKTFQAKYEAVQ